MTEEVCEEPDHEGLPNTAVLLIAAAMTRDGLKPILRELAYLKARSKDPRVDEAIIHMDRAFALAREMVEILENATLPQGLQIRKAEPLLSIAKNHIALATELILQASADHNRRKSLVTAH